MIAGGGGGMVEFCASMKNTEGKGGSPVIHPMSRRMIMETFMMLRIKMSIQTLNV